MVTTEPKGTIGISVMRPVHPGEVLRDKFDHLGLTASAFARALGVPANRVTAILNGQRGITADTALRLARYFGSGPEIWMNLQTNHDLAVTRRDHGKPIEATFATRTA
jgi:addiction module HigA family antidote